MTKKHTFSFHSLFAILLSVSILIAGVCLICGCLTIYFSEDHTYSREIVAETFQTISIPVYVCLILALISAVWEFISPLNHSKIKPVKDYKSIISKLSAKKDFTDSDNNHIRSVNAERNKRKIHTVIRTCVIVITSIVFLVYALNSNNFHQSEINNSMIKAMLILIPCLIAAFGYAIFTAYYCVKSYERELELIKQLPTAVSTAELTKNKCLSNKTITIIKAVIVVLTITIILYGYITGGTADVLAKAINICTECIGLG